MIEARLTALAAELGRRLLARGWTCTTAESCTGGLVAGAITAIAGSSAWFERGYVTYSNAAKHEELDVTQETLETQGAVSEATARALALGALRRSGANIAVAVTGIAGPTGGSVAKPVGRVCFAWARQDGLVESVTRQFEGDRAGVRAASVEAALVGLVARIPGVG
jgi:nicotinamide-nucleotide amidase